MASTIPRGQPIALAACGVAAPLLFIGAVVAASLKHPGYDHLKNFISELGATGAPGAATMNFAGFLPYGVLMVAFALAINRGIRADAGGWLGPDRLADSPGTRRPGAILSRQGPADRPQSARELSLRLAELEGASAWTQDRARDWWVTHSLA